MDGLLDTELPKDLIIRVCVLVKPLERSKPAVEKLFNRSCIIMYVSCIVWYYNEGHHTFTLSYKDSPKTKATSLLDHSYCVDIK